MFNYQDAFPRDPKESLDSDGDGIGDNSDQFPNDLRESVDEDNSGVGDNTEKDQKLENELDAIDKDFRLLQEMSDEKRAWQKNAYKDIKTSLNGQEIIYRANAPLKKEWEI